MHFEITATVTGTTEAELGEVMTWIQDNYPNCVRIAGNSETMACQFTFSYSTLAEIISTVTAIKQRYGTRLQKWNMAGQ